jgi:hypothetical protein
MSYDTLFQSTPSRRQSSTSATSCQSAKPSIRLARRANSVAGRVKGSSRALGVHRRKELEFRVGTRRAGP